MIARMSSSSDQEKTPINSSQRKSRWRGLVGWIGTFIAILTVLYLVLNAPALWIRTRFFLQGLFGSNTPVLSKAFGFTESAGRSMDITTLPPDDRIKIPRINVDVPILFPEEGAGDDQLLQDLEKGVIRYPGTGEPGQGNLFITGHSSQYWLLGGQYNTAFTLLPELKTGDMVYVFVRGKRYVYELTGSRTVDPRDATVLAPTQKPTISLMTCVPIGTNISRLIWTGNLIAE